MEYCTDVGFTWNHHVKIWEMRYVNINRTKDVSQNTIEMNHTMLSTGSVCFKP